MRDSVSRSRDEVASRDRDSRVRPDRDERELGARLFTECETYHNLLE
jgi:hypothetical protein